MGDPVEPPSRDEYDGLTAQVALVEADVHDIKDVLGELKVMVTRIDAQIPYLATKADVAGVETRMEARIGGLETRTDARIGGLDSRIGALETRMEARIGGLEARMEARFAELPSKTYMWGILGALLTAYACGLAALAILK